MTWVIERCLVFNLCKSSYTDAALRFRGSSGEDSRGNTAVGDARVRYFTDGARRMRGAEWGELRSMRALRVAPVSVPHTVRIVSGR